MTPASPTVMRSDVKHAELAGKLVIVGFGSIGQATLPLLLRHLVLRPDQIVIITASSEGATVARQFNVDFHIQPLTEANHLSVLEPHMHAGGFLLNLSVDVSSLALVALCWRRGMLYLDTCIEPWAGGYHDTQRSVSQRSNYALREEVLAFGRARPGGPTAVLTHGANPGLASTFVKRALLSMAGESALACDASLGQAQWAALARALGIKAIHIAERDTQITLQRRARDEFVNTWSVVGMLAEGRQPAELGWGTHERHWPIDAARHGYGCDAAIYLDRPGMATRVRSWTPLMGAYHGFLITHGESISIADHLTLMEEGKVVYRPTVHYAYHPSDDTVLSIHELAGNNWHVQSRSRIARDELIDGMDELGVLLMGNDKGVYWYGSRLSLEQARQLVPYNNATSLQVAAGVLAGIVWAVRNPQASVVEPDDLDHEMVMSVASPYLGALVGVRGDWTPLRDRGWLFDEDVDREDPWQFKNLRVV